MISYYMQQAKLYQIQKHNLESEQFVHLYLLFQTIISRYAIVMLKKLYKQTILSNNKKVTEPKYETVTTKTNLLHGTHGGFYHQDLLKRARFSLLSREDHVIPVRIGTHCGGSVLKDKEKIIRRLVIAVWITNSFNNVHSTY